MTLKRKTAFISYSWDSDEHGKWVWEFANDLRSKAGVIADIDKFHAHDETVNLYEMMINGIRDNDYVMIKSFVVCKFISVEAESSFWIKGSDFTRFR
ncbi:SEFIR domain-containing protein [Sporolactobacillus sp. Y61]|uniref:SEFIR domain-containing protein n=1 Tax=Sporolactobacillus sp. Y61 TaxID=3160863 RepID=A0AAU8II91_9BACL